MRPEIEAAFKRLGRADRVTLDLLDDLELLGEEIERLERPEDPSPPLTHWLVKEFVRAAGGKFRVQFPGPIPISQFASLSKFLLVPGIEGVLTVGSPPWLELRLEEQKGSEDGR